MNTIIILSEMDLAGIEKGKVISPRVAFDGTEENCRTYVMSEETYQAIYKDKE